MQRRLAAILIADVVGYSRLSHVDEEGTRRRFQSDLRQVLEPLIAQHQGRLVKTMGDGVLVEFASVVAAVRCAVEIQIAKASRAAQALDDQDLVFRIGINLGDVIVEDDDIQGDGVNIAARLQGLAEPGGIAISGSAYDQIEKRLDLGYAFQGEQTVKNIDSPIRVYHVLTGPEAVGRTVPVVLQPTRRVRWLPLLAAALVIAAGVGVLARLWPWPSPLQHAQGTDNAASIVVLPFENAGNEADETYLANGITTDITTDLAQVPGLFVTARHAAARYRNQALDPAQIAAELHVRYVLEGSVRRAGDTLRISAELVDTTTGGYLWAERFDGPWADVFALQDSVVAKVAEALELRLVTRDLSVPGGTTVPAAYEAYQRGIEHYDRFWTDSPDELGKAVGFLEQAVALDPDYGDAYAALAEIHLLSWDGPRSALGLAPADILPKVTTSVQNALRHPSARTYRVAADLQRRQRAFAAAIDDLQRAIALDPNDPANYTAMAWVMLHAGRHADARQFQEAAIRLDARYGEYACDVAGLLEFTAGAIADAAAIWRRCVATYPLDASTRMLLVAALGRLGQTDEAGVAYAKANDTFATDGRQPFSLLTAESLFPLGDPDDAASLRQGLLAAGVPELPFGYDQGLTDRLSAAQVKALLYGRTVVLRDIDSGRQCRLRHAADGTADLNCGDGVDTAAPPQFVGDLVCYWWSRAGSECLVYAHAPGATGDELLVVAADHRAFLALPE